MKNRRMRTRMYGGVRGRETKKVGRNSKIFVFLLLDYWYPEDYLFSNQFMEDLGRIYRLKKVIPDPEIYASR